MRKILNGPAVRIAVEANKPDAIKALEKAFADIEGNVEIVVLPVLYPQGSEKHQIYATVKRIVPEGALPIAVGCVVENVGTVAAIADAVEKGIPLTERVTTVSGDGVVEPKNVLAPIGTRYADLVAFCGGEKEGVRKVISGGPMMGFNVPHLEIATTKTTSGLLFFTSAKVFQYTSNACINCGRCVRACPMQLNPAFICSAVESNDIAAAQKMDVMDCIECGACSFGCPASSAAPARSAAPPTATSPRTAAAPRRPSAPPRPPPRPRPQRLRNNKGVNSSIRAQAMAEKKHKGMLEVEPQKSSAAQFLTYIASTGAGGEKYEIRYEDENIWMSQKMLAAVYGVEIPNIAYHLRKLFADTELDKVSVIKEILITAPDGKRYNVNHYNLQVIIALGFKIDNERAVQFRKWANQIVSEYTVKGWVLDDQRPATCAIMIH